MKEARLFQNLSRFFNITGREAPLAQAEAFSALYEQTYLAVFRYLYGWTGGNTQDAEDLTAETFTRAWKARHTYTGDPQAATGWLLGIAKRLAIDAHRRRSARIQPEGPLPDEFPLGEPTPENRLVADEQLGVLRDLLQRLPAEQREMLVLRYFLDWRIGQIGEYLKIPDNTVSVTIRRALARLQRDWPQAKE